MAGSVPLGGGAPVSVQSMTNTPTKDVQATLRQIRQLAEAGCEIVRASVPDEESVAAFGLIKMALRAEGIDVPLVADVHFDYRLALGVIAAGADKIRFNPGNIGPRERALEVATAARDAGIPVRVGVNAGSLRKEHWPKKKAKEELAAGVAGRSDGDATTANSGATVDDDHLAPEEVAQALVNSALWGAELVSSTGHEEIILSVKSSSVPVTIAAYRLLAQKTDYPLHLGLTEAGTTLSGAVKSAAALAVLLEEGIGDTLRVSLTTDPVTEVGVAYDLLNSLGLRKHGVDLIACPTCARCEINLIDLAESIQQDLAGIDKPLKVAVMGCVVNGPGEAREADIGIAAGKGEGLLFVKGEIVAKVKEAELRSALRSRIDALLQD